ncbi:uncharacterized protein LOC103309124 [Acyrthosiphon pisum]|uniref:Uncharacterized protein n=1 Tax=Acyrthosiphon pisum TaxID=7029 RepID=A0A8R2F819_ACYPI|nr:uncharacterized protein LOC103309124 [Acyrthosiphon pisum]|eukprot:XP_008182024.1 PREDICTED: uncharacterized protein LOC103309124 [Acyrthosiphon pisum]
MSPMKTSTIQRLELCVAVLLARWLAHLLIVFGDRLRFDGIFAWLDSQIVLSWSVNPHTCYTVFISNRVHLVHQLVPSCRWGYVWSAKNPTNCASRGLLPSDLVKHILYWSGPAFLKDTVESWDMQIYPILLISQHDQSCCLDASLRRLSPKTEIPIRVSDSRGT